jgi:ATP:dephospho-CoA triphosphoribosyl transferase
MAIMSSLVDTCLLHRGGWRALHIAKQGARTVLEHGGTGTSDGMEALMRLEALLLDVHASPGGSADLLAGTLFLDSLARSHLGFPGTNGESPEAAAYIFADESWRGDGREGPTGRTVRIVRTELTTSP